MMKASVIRTLGVFEAIPDGQRNAFVLPKMGILRRLVLTSLYSMRDYNVALEHASAWQPFAMPAEAIMAMNHFHTQRKEAKRITDHALEIDFGLAGDGFGIHLQHPNIDWRLLMSRSRNVSRHVKPHRIHVTGVFVVELYP